MIAITISFALAALVLILAVLFHSLPVLVLLLVPAAILFYEMLLSERSIP
jgi:hypothetical protein